MAKAAKRAPVKAKAGKLGKPASKPKSVKPAPKAKKAPVPTKAASKTKAAKVISKKPASKKPAAKVKPVKSVPERVSKSPAPKVEKKPAVAAKAAKPPVKSIAAPVKTVALVAAAKSAAPAKVAVNGKPAKLIKGSKSEKSSRLMRPIPFTPPIINEARTAAPVPTDSKPRKNQAGFTARELEHFRDMLLAKRRETVGDMSAMERDALHNGGGSNLSTLPIHMADIGTDNYEQEFTLGLVETDRKLLREINNALAKIQNGAFGICEGTGKPINRERLEVRPWARYSIEHAKQMERMGKGYQI